MTCEDCGNRFSHMEQTISEQEFGQCPGCLSENIKEDNDANSRNKNGK